jgi:alpha-mannosidase
VNIPETWGGRTVVGLFDFGQTDGGTNSGFESLLFLVGSPFQGVRLVGYSLNGGTIS